MRPQLTAGQYKPKATVRKNALLGVLGVLLFFLTGLALTLGPARLPLNTVLKAVAGSLPGLAKVFSGEEVAAIERTIIFAIRLPRIFLSVLVGAALALAGTVYQGLFRNPMADPYVLGTSSGAALGATLGFALHSDLQFFSLSTVSLLAFVGALLSTVLVYNLARVGRRVPLTVLLLSGIAVAAFLSAANSLALVLQGSDMQQIVFWLMGGFSTSRWLHVRAILPYMAAGAVCIGVYARDLNILLLGEEKAQQLGVDLRRLQLILTLSASLLVAAAVSVSGIIGFVGLVVPHMMRLLTGPDHRLLLPASALAGGIFLLAADTVARTVLAPTELPVGVITAFLGAPFFIYLLRKNKQPGAAF